MEHQMTIVFRRTGQQRYAVEALRPGLPVLEINPAPGYDSRIPHDMMHLVVEAQLGLKRGIFGQLAVGGDAGTFHIPATPGANSRQLTRTRKRVSTRGRKLLSAGRDECAQSERAAFICSQEWLARKQSKQAKTRREQSVLNQRKLDEICEHLDELSAHWLRLRVGESMAVAWPDLAIV